MRRICSLLLTILMVFGIFTSIPIAASAASIGSLSDNIWWELSGSGVLTIYGTGDIPECYYESPPFSDINVKKVVISKGITGIGSFVFSNCTNLTSVTIGNSVTNIGTGAFEYCERLTSIRIPSSVTNIGYCAFMFCTKLSSITIPDSVTSIGDTAFSNTAYYNDENNWEQGALYINNHLIDARKFDMETGEFGCEVEGAYIIKQGTKTIADCSFGTCEKLTSVILPNSVTSIGDEAFCGCGFISFTIPNGVKTIGYQAFTDCRSLVSITIPNSVTALSNCVFTFCKSLESVVIPDSIKQIEYETFAYCGENLRRVLIPDSVKYIDSLAFNESENVTIYGVTGSYAEKYARNRSIPFKDASKFGDFYFQKEVSDDSYIINVKALDKAGMKKNAVCAQVFVYSGKDVVLSKPTDEDGNVIFTKKELFNKGVTDDNIANCTVAAHLFLENGLQLCSENVNADGVWESVPLQTSLTLIADEPRMYYDVSIGFVGKTESERQDRWEEVNSVMGQFAEKFAQSTNGHALIYNYSIKAYECDKLLKKADHSIYVYDKPEDVGLNIDTASTNMKKNYMRFKYGNGYFNANTLCHEAGHMFFDFYDEYCYGLGYNYKGVKGAGCWDNRVGGTIPRPEGAPSNFGVMDSQHYGNIELSTQEDYSYLNGIEFSLLEPELYTRHYYKYKESTEETLMNVLEEYANNEGYSTSYSLTRGSDQNADYWEAEVDSVLYDSSEFVYASVISDYVDIYNTSIEKGINNLNIDFSFFDNVLTGSFSSNSKAYIFADSIDTQEIFDVSAINIAGVHSFSIPITKEGTFNIYVVENKNNVYLKETYTVDVKLTETDTYGVYFLVSIMYDEVLLINDSTQSAKVVYVLGIGEKVDEHELSATFHITENIIPQGLSWNVAKNNSYESVETTFYNGENNTLVYDCKCTEDGKYYIPLTNLEYSVSTTISNVSVERDSSYDDMVWVSFSDTIEAEGYYTVYYGTEEGFEPENMKFTTSDSSSKRIPIYLEVGQKYYIFVTYKSLTGEMYVVETPTTYTNAYIDSDNDGIPDNWLDIYFQLKDIDNIAIIDSDMDGLTNIEEYQNGTNPLNPDTDGDNVYDGIELTNKLNPLKPMTDGETDDYIVVYGAPDLKITDISFDDNYVYFNVRNDTDGKAMRTLIDVVCDGESIVSWTANIFSNSTMSFSFKRNIVANWNDIKIKVDDIKVTRDIDYTNNIFEYVPVTSISLEDATLVKGSSYILETNTLLTSKNEVYGWSYTTTNNYVTVDIESGVVTSNGIGAANIEVETLSGLSAACTVTFIPFEGIGFTTFDCVLINNNTEVAIIGYFGTDTDIIIPEFIGMYPVTQLNLNCIPYNATSVTISSSVKSINNNAFQKAATLEFIYVDENNSNYTSIDGVLFNKDRTTIIRHPQGKTDITYTIPNSVTEIAPYAFSCCFNLSEINLPNSAVSIKESAFSETSITELTLPENLLSIGKLAFSNCNNLCKINYNAINCTMEGFIFFLGNKNHPFKDSSNITEIIVSEKVSSIPSEMFYGMDCIESVYITNLAHWCSIDFKGANANPIRFAEKFYLNGELISRFIIPVGVNIITNYAFCGSTGLDYVSIPDSVTSIGKQVFNGFTGKIYCTKNSYAYEYAKSNGINYILVNVLETMNSQIDYDNLIIRTTLWNCNNIDKLLCASKSSTLNATASYVYGNFELYGTGSIVSVSDSDYIEEYTVVVEGDTNGDSVCDALDVVDVERASNGNAELEGVYAMAADSNSDDMVDIADYQSVVNKALAS